eukprot:1157480-Pelagomonas_calceolata.AAC.5
MGRGAHHLPQYITPLQQQRCRCVLASWLPNEHGAYQRCKRPCVHSRNVSPLAHVCYYLSVHSYTVPCASSTPEDISTSGRAADDEYMKVSNSVSQFGRLDLYVQLHEGPRAQHPAFPWWLPGTTVCTLWAASASHVQEYAQLKNDLIGGTRKSGGVLAAYLLLTVDAEAAVAALAGAAASNAYIAWLCRDVDNVKPTDRVPMWEAEAVRLSLQP